MTLLVAALLLQTVPPAFTSPREAFEAAEEHYQSQRFDEAIAIYEAYRKEGVEDGVLYYNLGNAYFKAGRLGRAVLSYERARRLLPGDEDVRANLAFANELIADSVEMEPLPAAVQWLVDAYRAVTPSALARFLSASFLAGGLALTVLLSDRWSDRRGPAVAVLALCATLALAAGTTLIVKLSMEAARTEAVVLSENAYVRSGPGEGNPRLAEIHEGLKVRVLGDRSGWLQISLANGLTGWVREDQVEIV